MAIKKRLKSLRTQRGRHVRTLHLGGLENFDDSCMDAAIDLFVQSSCRIVACNFGELPKVSLKGWGCLLELVECGWRTPKVRLKTVLPWFSSTR